MDTDLTTFKTDNNASQNQYKSSIETQIEASQYQFKSDIDKKISDQDIAISN